MSIYENNHKCCTIYCVPTFGPPCIYIANHIFCRIAWHAARHFRWLQTVEMNPFVIHHVNAVSHFVIIRKGNEGTLHQDCLSLHHISVFHPLLPLLTSADVLICLSFPSFFTTPVLPPIYNLIADTKVRPVYCLVSIAWTVYRPITLRTELNYSCLLGGWIC